MCVRVCVCVQVMKCTSELLIGPDWMANMELCDIVNDNVDTNGKDTLRALRRRLNRGFNNKNAKVMLLALTALDGCVKNCGSAFHQLMASSGVMDDIKKLWASMEVRNCKMRTNPLGDGGDATAVGIAGGAASDVDYEVIEKVLTLVAEWGDALGGSFMKTYDELRGMGAPFPERGEVIAPPIETPPQRHETEADRMARANKEAIQQAIAEVESENQVLHAAVHGSGASGACAALTQDDANPLSSGGGSYFAGNDAASGQDAASFQHHLNEAGRVQQSHGRVGGGAGAVVDGVLLRSGPQAQELQQQSSAAVVDVIRNWDEEKAVAANSILILSEMLAGVEPRDAAALGDELILELVGKCRQLQPRIVQLIETSEDESVLVEALQMNDDITKVLGDFDSKNIALPDGNPAGRRADTAPVPTPPAPLLETDQQTETWGYVPPPLVPTAAVSNADVLPRLVADTVAPPAPIFDLLTGDSLPLAGANAATGQMTDSMSNPFLMYAPPPDTAATPEQQQQQQPDATEAQIVDTTTGTFPVAIESTKPGPVASPALGNVCGSVTMGAASAPADAAVAAKDKGQTEDWGSAHAPKEEAQDSMSVASGSQMNTSSSSGGDPFRSDTKQRRDESRAQSQSLLGSGQTMDEVDEFWHEQLQLHPPREGMKSTFAL